MFFQCNCDTHWNPLACILIGCIYRKVSTPSIEIVLVAFSRFENATLGDNLQIRAEMSHFYFSAFWNCNRPLISPWLHFGASKVQLWLTSCRSELKLDIFINTVFWNCNRPLKSSWLHFGASKMQLWVTTCRFELKWDIFIFRCFENATVHWNPLGCIWHAFPRLDF